MSSPGSSRSLIAIGAGIGSQAAYSITPVKVHSSKISDSIGFINVAQIGGIVLALPISGAVFQNTAFGSLTKILAGMRFSEQDVRSAIAGSQSAVFESVSEEVRGSVIEAIVQAIWQDIYACSCCWSDRTRECCVDEKGETSHGDEYWGCMIASLSAVFWHIPLFVPF